MDSKWLHLATWSEIFSRPVEIFFLESIIMFFSESKKYKTAWTKFQRFYCFHFNEKFFLHNIVENNASSYNDIEFLVYEEKILVC